IPHLFDLRGLVYPPPSLQQAIRSSTRNRGSDLLIKGNGAMMNSWAVAATLVIAVMFLSGCGYMQGAGTGTGLNNPPEVNNPTAGYHVPTREAILIMVPRTAPGVRSATRPQWWPPAIRCTWPRECIANRFFSIVAELPRNAFVSFPIPRGARR